MLIWSQRQNRAKTKSLLEVQVSFLKNVIFISPLDFFLNSRKLELERAFEVIYFDFLHNVRNLSYCRVSAYWSGPMLPAANWTTLGPSYFSVLRALQRPEAALPTPLAHSSSAPSLRTGFSLFCSLNTLHTFFSAFVTLYFDFI